MGMAHTVHTLRPKGTRDRYYFSLRCRDAILSLAEALAIRPVMSNVQTPLTQYIGEISGDFEKVLQEIEKALVMISSLLPWASRRSDRFEDGEPRRDTHAYVPTRISQLRIGSDAPILEIGGGFA